MTDIASIGFRADTSGIHKANKGLDDLSKQGGKTDRALSGAGASIGKSFAGIAAAVGGLVSASAAMQKLISVSREFDVLNAGLITATGSADKAAQAFKAIEDFATTTPYSLAQATKAFTQLVNLGLTPSEKALTSYGNTAAAMGKDLSQMVEAVADATVGEFERLKEFGIKARSEGDNVSFTFRGMTTTVKKSADEIEGYLIGLGQNEFAGAMANRMNTLDGAISNLSDSWDGLFRTISSQGAGDLITSGIRMATDAIGELTDMIASGQLGGYLDAIGAKFNGWGADIANVLDFIGQLFSEAGEFWYLDMSESARLIVDAFKSIPENIRAVIQILATEIAVAHDAVYVYSKAIASYFSFTDEAVNLEKEFERIAQARETSLVAIMGQRDAALQSFSSQITAADGLRVKYDELNGSVDKSVDRLEQYKVVVDKAAQSTAGLVKEIAKLDDAALDYFDALEELDQIEKDRISRKEEAIEAMLEPFEEGTKAVDEYASLSEKAAERIESAFADAWVNAFDGFESVVGGMKNAFKRMLAEMAHMALTKPIMVSMGLGGSFGASASTGLSSGLGLLGGIGGALTGAGGMLGGAFGGGLAGAGGLISAGNIGGLFSGAGSLLGSGNIMAGLGMSLPIIAGAVVAAMGINKLTGGGLFGTSFKTDSQSLGLSLGGGDISGLITTEESRKKSLFRGTKRRTSTSGFDASAIDDAFDQVTDAVRVAAETFGIEGAAGIISGFTASANINIKDKSEAEIQAAIEEWVGNTTGALVNAVFGDSLTGLQKEGEGVIDTVNRLSMNMGAVQSITKALGLDFGLTGKAAMIASTNIVELAGGIDKLAALSSQYYQSFYSESEQQAMLAGQLTAEFAKLNIAMPMTREGFRGLVDGLDLTSESGQAAFAALMQLVPGMDQYLSAIEQQKLATEQAADAALKAAEAAQKEAEQKAKALEAQGLDLQLRLYDALGKSSEALALRRQMELAATDESLRAMLMQIYAIQDAAAANESLTQSLEQAADAASQLEQSAEALLSSTISKLQDTFSAEKDRISAALDVRLSALDDEADAIKTQAQLVAGQYAEQATAANRYVDSLKSVKDVIDDFIGSSTGASAPFKRLSQILSEAKGGLTPDASELGSVLSAINSTGSDGYSSAFDQNRAMAIAKNQALELGKIIGVRQTDAEQTLSAIEAQSEAASAYYDKQLAAIEAQRAQLETDASAQIAALDAQLVAAEKQYNALMGIDGRMLSVADAIAEFEAAINGLESARSTSASAASQLESAQLAIAAEQLALAELQVDAITGNSEGLERIETAITDLRQTIIDIQPIDRIWLPPQDVVSSMPVAAENKEVVELLNKILEASKANADHASKSTSLLQEMTIGGIDVRVEA